MTRRSISTFGDGDYRCGCPQRRSTSYTCFLSGLYLSGGDRPSFSSFLHSTCHMLLSWVKALNVLCAEFKVWGRREGWGGICNHAHFKGCDCFSFSRRLSLTFGRDLDSDISSSKGKLVHLLILCPWILVSCSSNCFSAPSSSLPRSLWSGKKIASHFEIYWIISGPHSG